MPFAQLIDPVLIAIWGRRRADGAVHHHHHAALHARRARREHEGRRLRRALVAAFPHSGFMGFPLLIGLLGEKTAGPLDRLHPHRHRLHQLAVPRPAQLRRPARRPRSTACLALQPRGGRAEQTRCPWAIALGAVVAARRCPCRAR